MACARSSCGRFQDQSFASQDWKYTNKRRRRKDKVQKNAKIPFCEKMKAFPYEIVFREIQTCFLPGAELGLFWTIQGSEVFLRNLRYILYSMVKKCSFLKGNFHGPFAHFSTFWLRRERKTTKFSRFENWFYVASCHVLSRCNLRERIHSPVSVTRIAFKD